MALPKNNQWESNNFSYVIAYIKTPVKNTIEWDKNSFNTP